MTRYMLDQREKIATLIHDSECDALRRGEPCDLGPERPAYELADFLIEQGIRWVDLAQFEKKEAK